MYIQGKKERKKNIVCKAYEKVNQKKIENIDVGDTENHSSIFFMKSISRNFFVKMNFNLDAGWVVY